MKIEVGFVVVDSLFVVASIACVFFSDYLEVAPAVVVPRGVGKTSPRTSIYWSFRNIGF